MRKPRADGQETRQNLLMAAAEVFAEKGYWEATNADICAKAMANIAAINYHFGSKDNLYIEAWKYSFDKTMQRYPPEGGLTSEAPAQQRLRSRILSFMRCIADPETHDFEILHKEMANPTGLLTEIVESNVIRIEQGFRVILDEILGDKVSDRQIRLCQMSLLGQCFGPMLHLRHRKEGRDYPPPRELPSDFTIEELADHIILFSLTGINGIRDEINNTKS